MHRALRYGLGCAVAVALLLVAVDAAKLKVKVYIRGEPQKWGQKIVVPDKWADFVQKSRDRLELPTTKFPVIRFYDNEDFEMQNIEEMDNNQHVFIDTSGQDIPPPLKPEQRHVFPNPILAQQMGLATPNAQQQQQQQAAAQQQQQPPAAAAPAGGMPQATDAQFGAATQQPPAQQQQAQPAAAAPAAGGDRGALLVSLPVQVLDNGKLRVEQVELYANDDAEDVARVFCINHRIGDPECAKLLEALKQRREAAVGKPGA